MQVHAPKHSILARAPSTDGAHPEKCHERVSAESIDIFDVDNETGFVFLWLGMHGEGQMSYHVAFWNLENLFAPENFPDREPWLAAAVAKDLQGWTPALFERKVSQLASIIRQMNDGTGPDLLGVCEVENAFAVRTLADLLNQQQPAREYQLVHVDSTRDHRGIDTAFVYDANRLTANPAEVFSHWVMRRTGTRDITQATFTTQAGNELVAFANHWPSRSARPGQGARYSAGYRAVAGETLSFWHERVREIKGPNAAIIAMGDLNDDPFDDSVSIQAMATRERGDVERAESAKFFNMAWRYLTQIVTDHQGRERKLDGTLYYDGNGNVFDQILVARGLLVGPSHLKVDVDSARIEALPEMVDHRASEGPIRFGLPKGDAAKNCNMDGFSDHFPVSVRIDEE